MANSIFLQLVALLAVSATTFVQTASAADSFSVQEFLAIQDQWLKLSRNATQLTLNGRFSGRVARQFRLSKFPITVTPERTTTLPVDVYEGERITITGKLRKVGPRYEFDASRIAIGANDIVRLTRQVKNLPEGDFNQAYELADTFQKIADFYQDEQLTNQIKNLRTTTFAKQRSVSSKNFKQLQQLISAAKKLGLDDTTQQNIRFESIVQMSKQKEVAVKDVLKRIRDELPSWNDSQKTLTPAQQQAFQKDPIKTYEAAFADQRPAFHRTLYRTLRLPEIIKELSKDGSNGDDIASAIRKELPEEVDSIQTANTQYVAFRMTAVPKLTRRQLSELEDLLVSLNRKDDFRQALNDWLKAQEKRLNNQQLDGLLETADQYLFAFERWKNKTHRDTGIKYMKRAWGLAFGAAPEEATNIETRLEQLGWVRLRNQWMTATEVSALPDSDMDLAMKEGRVVEGMKVAQVIAILGEPGRRIRVASKGKVQEVWVFGDSESSGITVHLSRRSFEQEATAVVTKVARTLR